MSVFEAEVGGGLRDDLFPDPTADGYNIVGDVHDITPRCLSRNSGSRGGSRAGSRSGSRCSWGSNRGRKNGRNGVACLQSFQGFCNERRHSWHIALPDEKGPVGIEGDGDEGEGDCMEGQVGGERRSQSRASHQPILTARPHNFAPPRPNTVPSSFETKGLGLYNFNSVSQGFHRRRQARALDLADMDQNIEGDKASTLMATCGSDLQTITTTPKRSNTRRRSATVPCYAITDVTRVLEHLQTQKVWCLCDIAVCRRAFTDAGGKKPLRVRRPREKLIQEMLSSFNNLLLRGNADTAALVEDQFLLAPVDLSEVLIPPLIDSAFSRQPDEVFKHLNGASLSKLEATLFQRSVREPGLWVRVQKAIEEGANPLFAEASKDLETATLKIIIKRNWRERSVLDNKILTTFCTNRFGFSDEAELLMRELVRHLELKVFDGNDKLWSQGEQVAGVYILLCGAVSFQRIGRDYHEKEVVQEVEVDCIANGPSFEFHANRHAELGEVMCYKDIIRQQQIPYPGANSVFGLRLENKTQSSDSEKERLSPPSEIPTATEAIHLHTYEALAHEPSELIFCKSSVVLKFYASEYQKERLALFQEFYPELAPSHNQLSKVKKYGKYVRVIDLFNVSDVPRNHTFYHQGVKGALETATLAIVADGAVQYRVGGRVIATRSHGARLGFEALTGERYMETPVVGTSYARVLWIPLLDYSIAFHGAHNPDQTAKVGSRDHRIRAPIRQKTKQFQSEKEDALSEEALKLEEAKAMLERKRQEVKARARAAMDDLAARMRRIDDKNRLMKSDWKKLQLKRSRAEMQARHVEERADSSSSDERSVLERLGRVSADRGAADEANLRHAREAAQARAKAEQANRIGELLQRLAVRHREVEAREKELRERKHKKKNVNADVFETIRRSIAILEAGWNSASNQSESEDEDDEETEDDERNYESPKLSKPSKRHPKRASLTDLLDLSGFEESDSSSGTHLAEERDGVKKRLSARATLSGFPHREGLVSFQRRPASGIYNHDAGVTPSMTSIDYSSLIASESGDLCKSNVDVTSNVARTRKSAAFADIVVHSSRCSSQTPEEWGGGTVGLPVLPEKEPGKNSFPRRSSIILSRRSCMFDGRHKLNITQPSEILSEDELNLLKKSWERLR